MSRFTGTVTFITGASSGIGAALALEVARQGGDVVLMARRQERLQKLSSEIEAMGRQALALSCDVTRDGDLERAADITRRHFGRIDYVIPNAGFGVAGRFEKLTVEDFRRQFETNVIGVLKTVYTTREDLIASRGCLVLMGSVNGYFATPRLSAYAMSKFAVHGLAESLWYEFRPHRVGVVLIVPGFIQTEIRQVDKWGVYHPEMRDRVPPWLMMPAEKAARQIANAIYKRRRIKVITGHACIAVFLQRHCPRFLSSIVHPLIKKGLLG
jgi:short-subunit dehydrogenase